ncbi:hypothetical protein [Nesterenkonia pannonica]|uniref:hypothetical protein n=1 Tax=Nesterenkonia pannonica TaxID=1548602 RepID=UPI002164E52B|nr:hypothetical protein [Nesterenkonia pannonica]
MHTIDDGEILVDGKRAHIRSPNDARAFGIEAVYQDLALFDNLGIVNNLYLGNELTKPRRFRALGWLDKKAMEKDARRRLDSCRCTCRASTHRWASCPAVSARQWRSPVRWPSPAGC